MSKKENEKLKFFVTYYDEDEFYFYDEENINLRLIILM